MAKKKVSKLNPLNWNWKKISAVVGIGLVSFAGAGYGVNTFTDKPTENVINVENVNTSNFVTQADLANTNTALAEVTELVKATNEIVVENDVWESTAEALALDELEYRDYKDLRKEVIGIFSDDFNNNTDYDEIEDFEVTIKDVDFNNMIAEDKNGEVVFELKVEYDGDNDNNLNRYVTVTATIEDGEVENLVYSETA